MLVQYTSHTLSFYVSFELAISRGVGDVCDVINVPTKHNRFEHVQRDGDALVAESTFEHGHAEVVGALRDDVCEQ